MIDLKAIKARHAAGMDTRQSAHQDREDLLAEVERLQHDIADLQMLRDEHQMDVMHAFQEGGEEERRKVAEWLRAVGNPRSQYYRMFGVCETAGEIERGVHLRKEKW